jgi:hypothetical protein
MSQAGRALRLGGAAATAGLVLLAGCGSAHVTGAATSQGRSHAVAGSHDAAGPRNGTGVKADNGTDLVAGAGQSGPAAGSRAEALALAKKLLPQVILPPGTRVLRGPVPPRLRGRGVGLGARDAVDVHRQFAAVARQSAVARFFRGHVPAGMRFLDNGSDSDGSHLVWLDLADQPRHLPPGIYQAEVDLTVVPAPHGGTLVRADAQAVWLPPRAAAEHIDPARFGSVVLTADEVYAKNHTVTRRVTSRVVIARLAGLLNSLPAAPDLAMSCPMAPVVYRAGFAATADGRPSVVAGTGGCFSIALSVRGQAQPPLADQPGKLATYVHDLLGIRQ